jgi:hypothetical protein
MSKEFFLGEKSMLEFSLDYLKLRNISTINDLCPFVQKKFNIKPIAGIYLTVGINQLQPEQLISDIFEMNKDENGKLNLAIYHIDLEKLYENHSTLTFKIAESSYDNREEIRVDPQIVVNKLYYLIKQKFNFCPTVNLYLKCGDILFDSEKKIVDYLEMVLKYPYIEVWTIRSNPDSKRLE